MMRDFASNTFANFKPVSSASYSALLFVAKNCNLTAYFKISLSSDIRTTPTPPTFLVVDPPV